MPYPFRRRPPGASRQAQERIGRARGESLYGQIMHWLLAMEQYPNLRNAPRWAHTVTFCTGDNVSHWQHVTLMPREIERKTFLQAAMPLDDMPEQQLRENVIERLRGEGFRVGEPRKLACGCMILVVRPRKLA